MINKKEYFFIVVFLIFPILIFPIQKKIIYSGMSYLPKTLDPAQAWDDTSFFFTVNIFDTLVKINQKTFKIEPSLATSWEKKENGKTWILKLRKGVTFHDGSDFNSDSVVFSFKRQMDKTFKYRYYDFPMFDEIFENIKDVKKIDQYTVVFYLKKPFYPFLSTLTCSGASIVSPSGVKKYKEKFQKNPIGTGPFILKKWEENKQLTLKANPKYWGGKPEIDEFINIINPNIETLHNLFQKKKIDILFTFSISKLMGLKNLKWVNIDYFPTFSINFIAFNFNNKYLRNKNIRKAFCHLWDKKTLKYVFQNTYFSIDSIIPQGMLGYSKKTVKESFSINKAKELIKKEKLPLKISFNFLLENSSMLTLQLISLYSKNLKKVGIELKIHNIPEKEYLERIKKGDYDLTISGWIADYPDTSSIIKPIFSEKLQKQGFPNLSLCKNEEILKNLNLVSNTKSLKKRDELYRKINRIINEDVLCIPIFQDKEIVIYNNEKIKMIYISPLGNITFFDIKKR